MISYVDQVESLPPPSPSPCLSDSMIESDYFFDDEDLFNVFPPHLARKYPHSVQHLTFNLYLTHPLKFRHNHRKHCRLLRNARSFDTLPTSHSKNDDEHLRVILLKLNPLLRVVLTRLLLAKTTNLNPLLRLVLTRLLRRRPPPSTLS